MSIKSVGAVVKDRWKIFFCGTRGIYTYRTVDVKLLKAILSVKIQSSEINL